MTSSHTAADSLVTLIDEVRLQFHALARLADDLHRGLGVSAPMRAVLEYLEINGDAPVPRIADARGVTRQHVQVIVNDLVDNGWVELRDNPVHRRSHLIALTDSGRKTIRAIQASERGLLRDVARQLPAAEVRTAIDVLRAVRAEVERITDLGATA
jgi:DNA-binding MarR family transcriptional regulator